MVIASDGKVQELFAGLQSQRQMGVAKVFINVASPSVNTLSPTDISAETAGKQLEVGQECELRYINGPRLATIWDGKYFKLKRPLYSNQGTCWSSCGMYGHTGFEMGPLSLRWAIMLVDVFTWNCNASYNKFKNYVLCLLLIFWFVIDIFVDELYLSHSILL